MAKSYAAIPQGVQAYLGPEVSIRRQLEAKLEEVFQGWGYREIILPLYDYFETFACGVGPGLADKAYRFVDRDGSLLALRPDLTTLVAKTVATRLSHQALPIRLFYRGEVFRYEQPKAGRQRVFTQTGLELIGSPLLASDLEILLIVEECLRAIGMPSYRIAVGHAAFFQGICKGLELDAASAEALKTAVDHKDVAALERLVSGYRIEESKKNFLVSLPHLSGGGETLRLAKAVVRNADSRRALAELEKIHRIMNEVGRDEALVFDLSEVRGLDYYTGLIFKVYSASLGFELGGGGRYDKLLETFGCKLPAIGFSLSEDRLAAALDSTLPAMESAVPPQKVAISSGPVAGDFARALELRGRGVPICLDSETEQDIP